MTTTAKTPQQKKSRNTARRLKAQKNINQAAEEVIGLSPLVGVRSDDLTDAMKVTIRQVAKQPLIAAKHTLGYAGKLVDVVARKSEYTL